MPHWLAMQLTWEVLDEGTWVCYLPWPVARPCADEPAEYADPIRPQDKGGFFGRWVDRDRDPTEQRIERRRRGVTRQTKPFLVWILTVVMTAVLMYASFVRILLLSTLVCSFELVKNYQATGYAFAQPASNPMLGPQSIELVRTVITHFYSILTVFPMQIKVTLGARFPPCMKYVPDVPPTFQIDCANASSIPTPSQICTIEQICGFGGFPTDSNGVKQPNQSFRFITPIFLHAGIVHLVVNMFAQLILSGQVEKEMGSLGFMILYFAAGIFGNILGAHV